MHYHVAGSGRPLILLHPTPFSSKRYLPLLPLLGRRRRVFALDTPGYGQSFRPTQPPRIEDYADWMAEAIAALGYDRAPIYGDLTGSIIALAAAVRHPDRVSALALGVISYFAGRTEELERWRSMYPVGFQLEAPAADGSHFSGLFRRILDAGLHAEQGKKPTLDEVTEWVLDRQEARDAAVWGFEATFRYRDDAGLAAIRCPILLATTDAHGNEAQIARAKKLLPPFTVKQGPRSFQVAEVAEFLAAAIPDFLEEQGL